MSFTAQQQAQRAEMIGASEIAAVLGVHPHKTALDLYAEKVLGQTFAGNRFTRWGTKLEAVVADEFAEVMQVEILADQETTVHPVYPCLGATPDYRVPSLNALLEIKTSDARNVGEWGESGTDEVPHHVGCQVIQQMAVRDVPLAFVAVLLGGNDFRYYRLDRDRAVEQVLVERGRAFWHDHVLTKVPPPATDGASAARFVGQMFPRSLSEVIREATSEEADTIRALLNVRGQIDDLENEKALLEAELKGAIGAGAGLIAPTGSVSWKSTKSNGTDYKGYVEAQGVTAAQLAAWVRPGIRKFLLTAPKGAK